MPRQGQLCSTAWRVPLPLHLWCRDQSHRSPASKPAHASRVRGGMTEVRTTYNGYAFRVENARIRSVSSLPDGWNGLPAIQSRCENFQFTVEYFGWPRDPPSSRDFSACGHPLWSTEHRRCRLVDDQSGALSLRIGPRALHRFSKRRRCFLPPGVCAYLSRWRHDRAACGVSCGLLTDAVIGKELVSRSRSLHPRAKICDCLDLFLAKEIDQSTDRRTFCGVRYTEYCSRPYSANTMTQSPERPRSRLDGVYPPDSRLDKGLVVHPALQNGIREDGTNVIRAFTSTLPRGWSVRSQGSGSILRAARVPRIARRPPVSPCAFRSLPQVAFLDSVEAKSIARKDRRDNWQATDCALEWPKSATSASRRRLPVTILVTKPGSSQPKLVLEPVTTWAPPSCSLEGPKCCN
jgi:hypothetical protein